MKSEMRWKEARDIFLDLADLEPEEQREELLRLEARDGKLAEWVRKLLRQDAKENDLSETRLIADRQRVGPYEVLRRIGRGGMGEVYVARRADGEYESEVAIKLLHQGAVSDELLQRFLRERQTLARLDHEYIAQLFDGGTTEDGEPYLVMEYVEGQPADTFAAGLEPRERLELFLRIGQAVAHAHERGVVHRDLKPANILVRADGAPRLLDFGIARPGEKAPTEVLDEEPLTRTGHRLFTPEYASPEQVLGEPATGQSDVYALGVVLYQFLCGERPWSAEDGLHALERRILEDDPVPPSRRLKGTQRHRIAGDLDAICLQCLARKPGARYGTVGDLCADIERYLKGLPIRARRTGPVGRGVRLARRRPLHITAMVLSTLALGAAWWAWDAEDRGERSQTELLAAVNDRIGAAGLLLEEGQLDQAEAELAAALASLAELPEQPLLEARVLARRAVTANLRGEWELSLEWTSRGEELLSAVEPEEIELIALLRTTRAYALQNTDPGERSQAAFEAVLAYNLEHLEQGSVLRVDAFLGTAKELRRQGRLEEALYAYEDAVADARFLEAPHTEDLARALSGQAAFLASLSRQEEAIPIYEEALEVLAWKHGESHPSFAKVRHNLGIAHYRSGRMDEAFKEFERSLKVSRMAGGLDLAFATHYYLASIHMDRGGWNEVEAHARETLKAPGGELQQVLLDGAQCMLGSALARTGFPEAAREQLDPLLTDPFDLEERVRAEALHQLGKLLQEAGDTEAARTCLGPAMTLKRSLYGNESPDCQELRALLAGD